jgi:hypothetical protein
MGLKAKQPKIAPPTPMPQEDEEQLRRKKAMDAARISAAGSSRASTNLAEKSGGGRLGSSDSGAATRGSTILRG